MTGRAGHSSMGSGSTPLIGAGSMWCATIVGIAVFLWVLIWSPVGEPRRELSVSSVDDQREAIRRRSNQRLSEGNTSAVLYSLEWSMRDDPEYVWGWQVLYQLCDGEVRAGRRVLGGDDPELNPSRSAESRPAISDRDRAVEQMGEAAGEGADEGAARSRPTSIDLVQLRDLAAERLMLLHAAGLLEARREWDRRAEILTLRLIGDRRGAARAAAEMADSVDDAGRFGPATAMYLRGAAWSVAGEHERAIELLTEAVSRGYGAPDWLATSPDLIELRSDPRFEVLIERARDMQQNRGRVGRGLNGTGSAVRFGRIA